MKFSLSMLSSTTLLCATLFSTHASAELKWRDVFIVPAASFGYSTFNFPKKLDQRITFTNGEFALTTVYKKFLISGNISGSLGNESISEEDDDGNAKRRDIDILAGYQLHKSVNIFAGYKYGRTNISFTNRTTDIQTDDLYRQIGPYLGASYTYPFEKAGKVSFSLAYSNLDALNILHANTEATVDPNACNFETNPTACDLDDFDGKSEGTTKGFSIGVSWSIAVTPRLLYQTKFKTNHYQQSITYKNLTRDGSETFTSLMMGLAYVI